MQQQQQYAPHQNAFAGPSGGSIAPKDTQHNPAPAAGPLVATGDWTKDLVQLAKAAELKKHALTLQLHTAHILSAHASLTQKNKAIQDIKEQQNRLESERNRLLNCLREINEDRDKVDIIETTLIRECNDLRVEMGVLTDGEYARAKTDVDRLRHELGQPPIPSLQETLQEKDAQYLNGRRLNGTSTSSPTPKTPSAKRPASAAGVSSVNGEAKRPRGRPKGSKNKNGSKRNEEGTNGT